MEEIDWKNFGFEIFKFFSERTNGKMRLTQLSIACSKSTMESLE